MKLTKGTITCTGQDVTLRYLLTHGDHKVRVTIRSNAYKAQCFATAEVWSPVELKWNKVVHLSGNQLQTEEGLCYRPAGSWDSELHFEEDYQAILAEVKFLLD